MRSCIYGREKLLKAWMSRRHDLKPSEACPSKSQCRDNLRSLAKILAKRPRDLSAIVFQWSSFVTTWRDVEELDEELCKSCVHDLEESHDAERKAFWDALPSYFKLPAWEDLKDLES